MLCLMTCENTFDGTRQPCLSQTPLAIISRLHKTNRDYLVKKNKQTNKRNQLDYLDVDTFLTSLQPVVPLSAVRYQGSWWPQALLTEHLVALHGGHKEDNHHQKQHTAQYTYQPPPHSELTMQPWQQEREARNKQQG